MARDLEVIKKLEKDIGRKLRRLKPNETFRALSGYTCDRNENIVGLYLKSTQIADISFLKDLSYLTELDLSYNQISNISVLKGLKKIKQLYLRNNRISDVSALRNLTSLTRLDLSNNMISEIVLLKDLKGLKELNLMKNRITQLPAEIIDLRMNIGWLYVGEGVVLGNNPIEVPPIEILKKGREAVKTYFKSLEGKKQSLNEVKVILVGEGGAGKTSLIKQLLGEPFDLHEPQTHGINIKHWEVSEGNIKIKVHTWDFGGQQIMHSTHQFFLSERSLYILVLEGRKKEDAEYWLKHIESFGGDSPVLVVINKIDENPAVEVNRLFLQEKYKTIKGFYRVSCSTRQGIENFYEELVKALANIEIRKTIWADSWLKVKNQVETMGSNYISYGDFEAVCVKENIMDKASQDTLLDFLNDLGVILHFKGFDLGDTLVFKPEWVTEAVYKIINSKELAEEKGILKLNLLDDILKQAKENDYFYPREKYRFIIGLMKKFELCFKIDDNTLLFPNLLEFQESVFEFDYETSLKFLLHYDFLPKSVMPRFIVKRHKDIKDELRWRTGVVLEDRGFHSSAVVKVDKKESKISIFVNGEQKRDYFSIIRKTFRDINADFEKLKVIELVPVSEEPEITVKYDELIGLEQMGIKEYVCGELRRKFTIKKLLDGIESEDERFGKIKIGKRLLQTLKKDFLTLSQLEPHQRGFAFEKFLKLLFDAFHLSTRKPFKIVGEQLDGSIQLNDLTYLIEAKWCKDKIGEKDLIVFKGKVDGKAEWARGLFISISGFSEDGLTAFSKGKSTNTIGMNKEDLIYILDGNLSLEEAIKLKARKAAEDNDFYYPLNVLHKFYNL